MSTLPFFKVLDALGKPESGYLEGTTSSFGSYDECLGVVAPGPKGSQEPDFVGQYCTIDFTVPVPPKPGYYTIFKTIDAVKNISADNPLLEEVKQLIQFAYVLALRFGVCVPSTCTKNDVGLISQKLANVMGLISNVSNCEIEAPVTFNNFEYFVIVFLIVATLLSFVFTILDAYPNVWSCGSGLQDQNLAKLSFPRQLVRVFSINHHVVRLNRPAGDRSLECLYGIKFISFTWIIVGQSYIHVNYQLIREIKIAKSIVKDLSFQPVVNAGLAMDSFFFLTGLLIAYHTIGNRSGGKSFSKIFFISKKLWRVLPMTALGVALSLIIPLTSEGPIWKETYRDNTNACYKMWWTTLLFVQNFFADDNTCMPHLWYFSVDMQLYFYALIFLQIYLWRRSAGIALGLTSIVASCVLSAYVTFLLQAQPTLIFANPDPEQIKLTLYASQYLPHTHLGPYVVGMLLGAFLANKPDLRIPRLMQYVMWFLSAVINICVCYGVVVWNRGKVPEPLETMAYSALSRTAWSLGLAWMVVACYSGSGGIVSRFLSWKPFVVMSRLTFCAYLIHLLAIWFFIAKQKTTIMGMQHKAISLNTSGVASCFFVAFLLHVHFDGPLIQLGKVLLMRLNLFQDEIASQEVIPYKGDSKDNKAPIKEPESSKNDTMLGVSIIKDKFVYRL